MKKLKLIVATCSLIFALYAPTAQARVIQINPPDKNGKEVKDFFCRICNHMNTTCILNQKKCCTRNQEQEKRKLIAKIIILQNHQKIKSN